MAERRTPDGRWVDGESGQPVSPSRAEELEFVRRLIEGDGGDDGNAGDREPRVPRPPPPSLSAVAEEP